MIAKNAQSSSLTRAVADSARLEADFETEEAEAEA